MFLGINTNPGSVHSALMLSPPFGEGNKGVNMEIKEDK